MDYEDFASFAYGLAEVTMTFIIWTLGACLLLAVTGMAIKYIRKKPKKHKFEEENDSERGNMNDYMDDILRNAALQIHKLNADPFTLPDLNKELLFLTVEGGCTTKRGKLRGLSTVHRAGAATLHFSSFTSVTIQATLGIHNLDIHTEARAWYGKLAANFLFGATVKYVKLTAVFKIPILTGARPRATKLTIDEIGKITLNVRNLGLLNWIIQMLGFVLLNLSSGVMKEKLAEPVQVAINNAIAKVKIPRLLL